MNTWMLDGSAFLLLCAGMRLGQPRSLRAMCTIGLAYLSIFLVVYYVWLKWKFHLFRSHPTPFHTGISTAFAFEGFWKLLANLLLLQGVMPVALGFLLYFSIRWLVTAPKHRSSYY